jgi:ubiquinone/menaquinone biosynthesis C-methylase UbiE
MSDCANEGDFQGEKADAYDKHPRLQSFSTLIYTKLQAMPCWAPAGSRLLDYGCGTCNHAIPMAKDGAEVLGMDVSERMVELSREKVEKEGLHHKIKLVHLQGDAAKLLENEGLFDAATLVFVLHHAYKHVDTILSMLHKVLKQGGHVFVLELASTEQSKQTRENVVRLRHEKSQDSSGGHDHPHHCHDWLPADELDARAKQHGFTIEGTEPFTAVNAFGEGLTVDCYSMVLCRQ